MLRWRLTIGTAMVGLLLGICWVDHWLDQLTGIPGIALFPVLVAFAVLADREVLELAAAGGVRPVPWVVYAGSLLVITSSWISPVCLRFARAFYDKLDTTPSDWTLLALAGAVILVLLAELRRYERPGGVTVNVAAAVFAIVYVGLMLTFLVQLRLVWGLRALLAAVFVVKMGDTGAFFVGRMFGRNKIAPGLSPKKTLEGAVGAMVAACLAAWILLEWLFPPSPESAAMLPSWGWIPFGLLMGLFGMWGDLAESLIKRDVARKDSSDLLPGFGGVLDLLDSALIAAPVAYACWAFGVVA